MTREYECVWKAMGNLERIRIREAGSLLRPNDEEKCDDCKGYGILNHFDNNNVESCEQYLANVPMSRREVMQNE